ncbi:MAG: indolepyruvate ferredoxin oxidoreductase subunit alpha [Pseudomonadota bacterium]|nr:indolepyruvate ferredoxin oxidoreductase [Rhodospirillaceae bacterium]MEE2721069.1 indolepyruvate ferredoxin oxidoreductase subunit alpha [Pseudomonadota bacterium]
MSAERSFRKEVESLRLGDGEIFHGEGILAVTKALLQSGVAYVGGYQGAPVSHLLDVLLDSEELMDEMGVHVETGANEAAAAAMLGASINYPLRGAVGWKSIVGTNVAADALSNLASPGVVGGALIISGEDYGEGASIIQERTLSMAMKSSMWMVDPRPNLTTIVDTVEKSFELSEVSNTPIIMQLRIRACHVQGRFVAKDNRKPTINTRERKKDPAPFEYARLAHPPVTFIQEKLKVEQRLPAAQKYIREKGLNEIFDGDISRHGIIVPGGLYNTLIRRLARLGLADDFGNTRIPLLVLNVIHPLVPDQITDFCAGRDAVLVMEEGNPEYLEHQINGILRKADIQTRVHGKDVMPMAGEYNATVMHKGLMGFIEAEGLGIGDPASIREEDQRFSAALDGAADAFPAPLPPRPPQFCTGCPERPVFSALKLIQAEVGKVHIAADIGCHAFATFEPFSMGNSILGYGMSLASAAAVAPFQDKRSISIMGDGGFWHNGLTTGVIGTMLNEGDSVLVIMQNGFTSATGQQFIPSSEKGRGGRKPGMSIEKTLQSLGVPWLRKVRTYSVSEMVDTLREALTTPEKGLKVIIADGECQLARQRRLRGEHAEKLKQGGRVELPRFGIDDEVCTGDHSCIRLSGCPSLTIKPNPDPLRSDPVANVNNNCVGCGLCGEVSHAATLCPSFYRAERVRNPGIVDRAVAGLRNGVINLLQGRAA